MEHLNIIDIISRVIALLIAIIGHEIMHGRMAYYYGDSLAKNQGRLSINPLVHIDILGSIIIPLLLFISNAPFLFGWAKPVPINAMKVYENGGYNALSAVAMAGIAYNLFVALLASILLYTLPIDVLQMGFGSFLVQLLLINVVLAVFNAWPIPPLDGSQALSYQLRKLGFHQIPQLFDRVGVYGIVILMAILTFEPLRTIFFYPAGVIVKFLI